MKIPAFSQSNRLFFVLLTALAVFAVGVILYATAWGPVIFSDAVGYLTVARNILAGHGIGVYEASGNFSVMTLHPPFYSMLLAFFGLSGVDGVDIARGLHALFFGLMVILIGWGLQRLSGSSLLALCGASAVLASPLLLYLFSLAMSDATFLFLSVCATLGLLYAIERHHWGWLAVAALCAGLSVITRLVGAAWLMAGGLAVLIFWPANWQRRLGVLLGYASIATAPLALWQFWVNFIVMPPSRVRSSLQLGQSLAEFRLAVVDIFWGWLPFASRLPDAHYRVKLLALLGVVGLGMGLIFLAVWQVIRKHPDQGWRVVLQAPFIRAAGLLSFSTLAYLGMAAFGYVYSNPTPDLNERTLAPVFLLGLVLVFVICAAFQQAWPNVRWLSVLPLVCAGVMMASGLPQSLQMLGEYHRDGYGYLSQRWRTSPTLLAAMQLPADLPLITNQHTALTFWLGRPVYPIPEVVSLEPEPLDARFGDDVDDSTQQLFQQGGAALVVFNDIRWQLDLLYFEQTPARLDAMFGGLNRIGDYADGAIYLYPTTP